jgi:hypothetical protein
VLLRAQHSCQRISEVVSLTFAPSNFVQVRPKFEAIDDCTKALSLEATCSNAATPQLVSIAMSTKLTMSRESNNIWGPTAPISFKEFDSSENGNAGPKHLVGRGNTWQLNLEPTDLLGGISYQNPNTTCASIQVFPHTQHNPLSSPHCFS